MMKDDPDFFYWTVRLGVHRTWVADGFDLADGEDISTLLSRRLPYAYGHELGGEVIEAPDPDLIAKEQGYTGADDPRFRED